jgi:RHS repeat-associated protein
MSPNHACSKCLRVTVFSLLALHVTLLIMMCSQSRAQVPDPVTVTQEPIPGSDHNYIGMGTETVNPADGSVSFDLPIQTPAGRQLTMPFGIRYNGSEPFYIANNGESPNFYWATPTTYNSPPFDLNGWAYELPSYTAQAYVRSSQPDPNGQTTDYCWSTENYSFRGFENLSLSFDATNNWPDEGNKSTGIDCATNSGGGAGAYGLGTTLSAGGTGSQPPLTAADRSGTVYYFPKGPFISNSPGLGIFQPWGMLAQTITDRNGNQIVLNGPNTGFTLQAGSYTDTVGRTVLSWSGLGAPAGDQLTVSGLGKSVVVKWTTTTATFPENSQYVYGTSSCGFSGSQSSTISVVSEIDLPNGQKYTFSYGGQWGRLTRITFPDGGYVSYIWGTNSASAATYQTWAPEPGDQQFCYATFDTPAITDRYVSYNGTSQTLHQHFSYSTTWVTSNSAPPYWSSKTATVTSTDLVTGQIAVTNYTYSFVVPTIFTGASFLVNQVPVEKTIVYQDGSGDMLKTVNKTWFDQYFMTGDQTILDNGQGMTTLRCPDADDRVLATYEYDFQSQGSKPADPACASLAAIGSSLSSNLTTSAIGPMRRQTITAYHNFGAANILDEPDRVTVYDGSNNEGSQTTYVYDGTATIASNAKTGLVSPPGARGNATTASHWLNPGNSFLSTTFTYFDTGQVQSMTDPCGNTSCSDMGATQTSHTTSYSYVDNYTTLSSNGLQNNSYTPTTGNTNAYLTTVTDPLTHTNKFSYDFYNGQVTASTDANSQSATYIYYDTLARLTLANYPDGGQTKYTYNDAVPSPSVTSSKLISSPSTSLTTITLLDGMGHTVQTELTTDPQAPDYVNTSYDGMGRVYTVSNPHRSTSSPTDGISQYGYDALGRTTLVLRPDGSSVNTSYSGNCATVVDETGAPRESCSDWAGRLSEVEEPGAGATIPGAATGWVTISGVEQTLQATAGQTGLSIGMSGGLECTNMGGNLVPDNGTITVQIGSGGQSFMTWGGNCTNGVDTLSPSMNMIAQGLAGSINASGANVTATPNGTSIQIVANSTGSITNYQGVSNWSASSSSGGVSISPEGTWSLSGGHNAETDSGTVTVTINGVNTTVNYGSGSTASSIATAIVAALNQGSLVTAQPPVNSGNTSKITFTANEDGTASDYSLSASPTWNTQYFTTPSFTTSTSGSTLTGGSNGGLGTTPLITLYTYDALNDLTAVQQQGGTTSSSQWRNRSFIYDSLSRLTQAVNPESGTISYTYDANSNLATRTVPEANQTSTSKNTITSYSYDVLNRLTAKNYANPSTGKVLYAYDVAGLPGCPGPIPPTINGPTNLVGRRTAMCSSNSSSAWSYDFMGRPLFEARDNKGSSAKVYTVGYTYFKDGSLNTLTYPSGDVMTYTVAGAGRPLQLTDSGNNFATSAAYTPSGLLNGMTSGNGIVTSNVYNDRLQPILLSAGLSGHSPVFSLCYDFHSHTAISSSPCTFSAYTTGNNGNVFQIINNVNTAASTAYKYDLLNRISQGNTLSTTGSYCWGETYSIDNWGNLTNRGGVSGMGSCTMEPLSASATVLNQLSGIGVVYDAAGNVTNDGNGNQPTYDTENRIATDAGVTYQYDADGVRIEKSSGTMYWTGPGGEYLTETDLSGNINEEYVYFNGERIARVDRPTGTVHYYFSDRLNSSSVITDASGNVVEQYYYYPYGGMQSSSGSDPNHYKFNGKERDTESNLDEFGARYYTSAMGRFMIPDWAGKPTAVPYANFGNPQSLNLYSFVENNPTTMTDPNGHCNVDGERHNLAWCALHALGITQTQHEEAEGVKRQLSFLSEFGFVVYRNGQRVDPSKESDQSLVKIGNQLEKQANQNALASWNLAAPTIPGYPYMEKPNVTHPELEKIVDELYQPSDVVPGGTAGAVRYEQITGNLLSPAGHAEDAENIAKQLNNFLKRNPGLSANDQAVAKELIKDLENAVAGK